MKDDRKGESLWIEWDGSGYNYSLDNSKVFYTIGHVPLDNELVRKALASTIQRDGISDSLADGFKSIENAVISQCWGGYIEDDVEISICDEEGFTDYGDEVLEIEEITLVEF